MDQRLVKALEASKNLESINRQKAYVYDKFLEKLQVYYNGGAFTADAELVRQIGLFLSKDEEDAVFLDNDNIPISVTDLYDFYHIVWNTYNAALKQYKADYDNIVDLIRNKSV